jgi:hypothetical protein
MKVKELSPDDNTLVAHIENKTGKKVTVGFEENYIKLSWNQNGSDGDTKEEGIRINQLKDYIRTYLKDRLMEFFYINDCQFVYFRYE